MKPNLMMPLALLIGLCGCGSETDEQKSLSRVEQSYVSVDSTGRCDDFTDGLNQSRTATCPNGTQVLCKAAEYDYATCLDGSSPCMDTCNDTAGTFGSDTTWDSGDWDRTSEVQMATFAYLAANTASRLADKNSYTYCNNIKAIVTRGYTWFSTETGWAATAIQANKGNIPKYHSGAQSTSAGAAAVRAAALKASLRNTLRILTTLGGC